MIAGTYSVSGILLAVTGYLFAQGTLSATTQMIAWTVIFFVASAAASAAHLTVSEVFPLETRAIAFFYAVGTAAGGAIAPAVFGALVGVGLMVAAAAVELALGVKAERESLENVATPLSVAEAGGSQ